MMQFLPNSTDVLLRRLWFIRVSVAMRQGVRSALQDFDLDNLERPDFLSRIQRPACLLLNPGNQISVNNYPHVIHASQGQLERLTKQVPALGRNLNVAKWDQKRRMEDREWQPELEQNAVSRQHDGYDALVLIPSHVAPGEDDGLHTLAIAV